MRLTWVVCGLAVSLAGCSLFSHHEAKPEAEKPPKPEKQERLSGTVETFSGRVVLLTSGYRLRISDKEVVRLTRAHKASEFVNEEINLRKYFEKTLAVRGRREGDWVWGADIVGQWNRPGESRGANLLAPPSGEEER
jgi:hypothetical protein